MERRQFVALLGVAGVGVAGCVSDDGTGGDPDDPENDDGENGSAGQSNGTSSDGQEPGENAGATATPDDPVAAAEAFLDALDSKQQDQIDALVAAEGPLGEMNPDEVDALTEESVETEAIEIVEQTDEEVIVEATVRIGGERSPPARLALRPNNGWKVWRFDVAPEESTPTATFDLDRDGESITITHESGDSVRADELYVRGEGLDRTGSWEALGGSGGDDDGRLVVRVGDSLTLPAASEVTIRIVWEHSGSDQSAVLTTATIAGETDGGGSGPESVQEYLEGANGFDGTVLDRTGNEEVTVLMGVSGDGEDDFVFDPPAIQVDPGTTVTWEHTGAGLHTITEQTDWDEDGEEDDRFDSGLIEDVGETWSYTFETDGTFLYFCAPHKSLGMKGAVVVG